MKEIDLRDIFDDCYGGYQDFTVEISLLRDPATGRWANDSVTFWKADALGWCYRTATGERNYGYETLRDAVIRFSVELTIAERGNKNFCAHRLYDTDYRQSISCSTLYCKTTWRFFIPREDHEKIQLKCNTLTLAFNTMLQQSQDHDDSQKETSDDGPHHTLS